VAHGRLKAVDTRRVGRERVGSASGRRSASRSETPIDVGNQSSPGAGRAFPPSGAVSAQVPAGMFALPGRGESVHARQKTSPFALPQAEGDFETRSEAEGDFETRSAQDGERHEAVGTRET
jgi:hypothetical protein